MSYGHATSNLPNRTSVVVLRHWRRLVIDLLPFAAIAVSLRHSRGVQTHYLLRLSSKFAFAYCGRVAAAHCVSPMLIDLRIFKCFFERQPVVDITIDWAKRYDPSSVQLGELAQLRILSTLCFADALPECQYNWGIIMLLRRFWKIPALFITIIYPNVSILYTSCYNAFETFLYLFEYCCKYK